MKARLRVHEAIPEDIKEDLLAVGLLRRRLHELLTAVERRQDKLLGQLLGVKVDTGLLADLLKAHNERAARIRAVRP